jgi:hypothetical protein
MRVVLVWECSSDHRVICSVRKANRAAGSARGGEALGAAAKGSYEQEAAAVEEDEEMKRGDEQGVAKRPDLNKLDVSGWAELALNKMEYGCCCCRAHRCPEKGATRDEDESSDEDEGSPPSRSKELALYRVPRSWSWPEGPPCIY